MTKRFFVFAALILLAYAFYSYTANPLLLAVALFLLILMITSLIAMLIGSLGLRIEGSISTPSIKRLKPFTLRLRIMNRGWVYLPAVRLSLGYPRANGIVLTVPTDENDDADYDELAERLYPELRVEGEASHLRNAIFNYWQYGGGALQEAEGDRDGVSRVFYRPASDYQVYRKPLLFPTPRLIDEQKLRFLSLAPRQEIQQNFMFMANHKGTVPFGVDHIILKDWFGFFFMTRRFKVEDVIVTNVSEEVEGKAAFPITVQPSEEIWEHVISPTMKDPKQVLMAPNSVRVSSEIDTLANIRDYQPGDRMKLIHWKNSARTGEWMIREFEDPRQGGLLFVPEPLWPAPEALDTAWEPSYCDQMAEVTAALLSHLSKHEGPLSLLTHKREIEAPGEGQAPLTFYRELATWQPERQGLTHAMLIHEATRRRSFRGVVIIASSLTSALESELHRLQKSGSQVILALLHAPEVGRIQLDEQTKLLRLAKVHVIYFPCQGLRDATPIPVPSTQERGPEAS